MRTIPSNRHKAFIYYPATLCLLLSFCLSEAQPNLPPRSNIVRATQPIHFGSFCITDGGSGTVTVNPDGTRTATGNILLLNIPPFAQPAIFEIKLPQKPTVCFNYEPPYTLLTGSSGTLELNPGLTNQGPDGSCFALIPNTVTYLRVGGTLVVTGSSAPGHYTGSLAIRFTQQ